MKTRRLLRPPSPSRPHFPTTRAALPRRTPALPGDWRYAAAPRARWASLLAGVAAAGLHAALLYGVPPPSAHPRRAARPAGETVLQLEMPAPPPEEAAEQPRELADASPAALAVPQLADVPSTVALSAFTQDLDLRPRTEVDLSSLNSMTVPVARGRAGGTFAPGAIFTLAQLDRVPQPLAQPMPALPRERRTELDVVVVLVEFVVDAEGRVIDPRVTRTDAPEFSATALDGIRRWKFRPGTLGGRKVATRMEVPLRFELKAPE